MARRRHSRATSRRVGRRQISRARRQCAAARQRRRRCRSRRPSLTMFCRRMVDDPLSSWPHGRHSAEWHRRHPGARRRRLPTSAIRCRLQLWCSRRQSRRRPQRRLRQLSYRSRRRSLLGRFRRRPPRTSRSTNMWSLQRRRSRSRRSLLYSRRHRRRPCRPLRPRRLNRRLRHRRRPHRRPLQRAR